MGDAPRSFKGGLHVRQLAGGVGAPLGGHLDVSEDSLRFHGLGFDVKVRRDLVNAVRFGPGIASTRISVVLLDPAKEQTMWFSTRHPEPVRQALLECGWQVVDDKNFDLGVADDYPGSPG